MEYTHYYKLHVNDRFFADLFVRASALVQYTNNICRISLRPDINSFTIDGILETCETFEWPPHSKFCKTRALPYDIVVCACLLVAKQLYDKNVDISSDGSVEDWKEAIELYKSVFGHTAPQPWDFISVETPQPFDEAMRSDDFVNFFDFIHFYPSQNPHLGRYTNERVCVEKEILNKYTVPLGDDDDVDDFGFVNLTNPIFQKKIKFTKNLVLYVEENFSYFDLQGKTLQLKTLFEMCSITWNGKRLLPMYHETLSIIVAEKYPKQNLTLGDLRIGDEIRTVVPGTKDSQQVHTWKINDYR